jgi:hypothetical protein
MLGGSSQHSLPLGLADFKFFCSFLEFESQIASLLLSREELNYLNASLCISDKC